MSLFLEARITDFQAHVMTIQKLNVKSKELRSKKLVQIKLDSGNRSRFNETMMNMLNGNPIFDLITFITFICGTWAQYQQIKSPSFSEFGKNKRIFLKISFYASVLLVFLVLVFLVPDMLRKIPSI